MLNIFNKKGRKIQSICNEYQRVFNTSVPDNDFTDQLIEIKTVNLEKIALSFDIESGYDYVIEKTGNLGVDTFEPDSLFIPRLSREYPVIIKKDIIPYGDYVGVRLDGIKHRLRMCRYIKWYKSGYFRRMKPFDRYIEIGKPTNPFISMQRW